MSLKILFTDSVCFRITLSYSLLLMPDTSNLTRTAICIPDHLIKAGRKAAKQGHQSFSGYISLLLERERDSIAAQARSKKEQK